jgi:hypothetical protein
MTCEVTKQELEALFTSKIGFHRFMTVDMDAYLPAAEYTSIEWLGQCFYQQKKVSRNHCSIFITLMFKFLTNTQAKHMVAPMIQGLRLTDLVAFLRHHALQDFLPSKTRKGKDPKIDRTWLVNVSETDYTES